MRSMYIKAHAANAHWVRNPDWPAMPSVSPGDKIFYGLYAVYENQLNEVTLLAYNSTEADVDWGDGASETLPNTVETSHTYDYATISADVLIDDYGFNYKIVMIQVDFYNTTTFDIDRDASYSTYNSSGWLDIVIDNTDMTTFQFSQQRAASKLERLIVYNHSVNNPNTTYTKLSSLKIMDFNIPSAGNYQATFQYLGDVRRSDDSAISLDSNSTTQYNSTFNYAAIEEIDSITSSSATQLISTFANCFRLKKITTIDIQAAINITNMFITCISLDGEVSITSSSSLVTITSFCQACYRLRSIEITDCSGITTTTNAFLYCASLESVILTGLTVGITVSNGAMSADAIDALFTSLGTASGTQTITVSGHPGSSTCDTSIATAKGWTVVT